MAVGVAVPALVVALAYVLWWVSDRLGAIGPFDRAAFGWSVVIPVWLAAPVAAGFVWHRLGDHHNGITAGMFGALIGGVAAALFWMAVADPACANGPTRVPVEWVVPSLVLGAAIGGGLAFSALVASRTFSTVGSGRQWSWAQAQNSSWSSWRSSWRASCSRTPAANGRRSDAPRAIDRSVSEEHLAARWRPAG